MALAHGTRGSSALVSDARVAGRRRPRCLRASLSVVPGPGGVHPAVIVERAIHVHGVEALENARISFDLRDQRFVLTRRDGWFRQERIYTIYLGLLPFRLRDPAVTARYLGEETLDGEPYHRVEVTFEQEGGGRDWQDRYLYWFHTEGGTLDYFAYRYTMGEGGTRFRRAVNRRTVDGILVQDYENLVAPGLEDIAEYGRASEEGRLEWVSDVVLENDSVARPPEGFPHDPEAPMLDPVPGRTSSDDGGRSSPSLPPSPRGSCSWPE